jgi:hypothetical protein
VTPLSGHKSVAVELIEKELSAIRSGDDPYPLHWERIIDICRQEIGWAPNLIREDGQ